MELISLIPESLILVVVSTNILGTLLKQINLIKDNIIPIILLMFSVIFSILVSGLSATVIMQGIICWGLAIGIHQTVHQIQKK